MRSVPHLNEVHCQGELQPFLVARGYFDREFESMVGKSASSRDAVFAILREFSRVSASFASFFFSETLKPFLFSSIILVVFCFYSKILSFHQGLVCKLSNFDIFQIDFSREK